MAPASVTDAYKTYYKIKQKLSSQENDPSRTDVETIATAFSDSNSIGSNYQQAPFHDVGRDDQKPALQTGNVQTPSKVSDDPAWGAHLNKLRAATPGTKSNSSSPAVSSVPSYSKITEKLMKGAKINIRSSLTRKKSVSQNKSVGSPMVTDDSPRVSADTSYSSNVFDSPAAAAAATATISSSGTDKSVHPAVRPSGSGQCIEDCDDMAINGFRPRIIHHDSKLKQSFAFRGMSSTSSLADNSPNAVAQPQVSNRQVDLQWLDDCLAGDDSNNPAASAGAAPAKTQKVDRCEDNDNDIVYSSGEEEIGRSPVKTVKLPVATGVKRKLDQDDCNAARQYPRESSHHKKSKTCETQSNPAGHGSHGSLSAMDDDERRDEQDADDEKYPAPAKISAAKMTNAAKRERLEKY